MFDYNLAIYFVIGLKCLFLRFFYEVTNHRQLSLKLVAVTSVNITKLSFIFLNEL